MKRLEDILSTKHAVYHLDGCNEIDIVDAEERIGLTFAEDYIEYLKKFSLLSYDSHELTGLCSSTRLNVVDATLREKNENEFLDDDMYLLETVGVENMSIWQNSRGEVFEVMYKQKPKKIYDSLLDYIESV